MSGARYIFVWAAFCLWAAAVTGAAIYGVRHGYTGHAFAITLGVLAFFLTIQLLFATGNLGERLARRVGSHLSVLLALIPFLAYLIYLVGTNGFTWWRVAMAAAYTLGPVLLAASAGARKPGAWQDYLTILAIVLP
jgi:hypothetical protein